MKKFFIAFAAVLLLFSATARAEDNQLYLYTWDTYVAPDLFKKFEKETGIKVITDIYSSNDTLMAKLKAGGAYDVVAPSGNYVPFLVAEKLLQPLPDDLKAISQKMSANVQKPAYDPTYTYALPLFYGTTGLAVDTKLTSEKITSWQQFFSRPAGEKAGLGVLDDVSTTMDIASLAANKPFCDNAPSTYKALQTLLLAQKPFVKVYGATGYSERLAANEIPLQMAWNGDVYKVRQQNPAIKYIYPKEGVELWIDNLAIPASAKHVEAAKKFIAFVLRPENAAQYSVAAGMMSSIQAANALLPEDMKRAPEFNIPAGIKAVTAKACPADVTKAYDQIWLQLTR
jgi:spermidine/putrescine transport system substrate-binding protein